MLMLWLWLPVELTCCVTFSDVYSSLSSYRYTPRLGSPLSIDDPVQRVRQQNYISRWNDMFSQDRLDAMDTLRRYSDDYENNQRIIFLAIQVGGFFFFFLGLFSWLSRLVPFLIWT
jgi:hypothetical protein